MIAGLRLKKELRNKPYNPMNEELEKYIKGQILAYQQIADKNKGNADIRCLCEQKIEAYEDVLITSELYKVFADKIKKP
jgi:hypothetical protein